MKYVTNFNVIALFAFIFSASAHAASPSQRMKGFKTGADRAVFLVTGFAIGRTSSYLSQHQRRMQEVETASLSNNSRDEGTSASPVKQPAKS